MGPSAENQGSPMHWPSKNSRRGMRALLVATIAATASVFVYPIAASAAPDPVRTTVSEACKNADHLLIAARGSGESSGLGPTMTAVYNAMAEKGSTDYKVNAIAVDYPARSVTSIPLVLFGNTGYFDGIPDGITKAVKLLQQVQTLPECESVSVTLGGYSQGAMVMHRLIQLFDAPQLRQFHVSSAVLVGDGDRIGDDSGVVPFGSASRSSLGIGQLLPVVAGSNGTRFNDSKDISINSVCNTNDPVCAPDWSVPTWCKNGCASAWRAARLLVGIGVHQVYPRSTALRDAARATICC
ncbi:cutinase family protein [Rhodococcus sp. KRD162]|uniref:cutinase family protein n=1 Tax=Rhodococcus sp. KRD162 TaxID=2729725 RepID=UPI0027DC1E45|nr:cutinase family protein [Rhodococcus sp. KRD162]